MKPLVRFISRTARRQPPPRPPELPPPIKAASLSFPELEGPSFVFVLFFFLPLKRPIVADKVSTFHFGIWFRVFRVSRVFDADGVITGSYCLFVCFGPRAPSATSRYGVVSHRRSACAGVPRTVYWLVLFVRLFRAACAVGHVPVWGGVPSPECVRRRATHRLLLCFFFAVLFPRAPPFWF